MRVARRKGAVAGPLLVILGLWGALIPFIGPYFNYGFGSNDTWVWHTSRLWMNVLPGVTAIVAGLILTGLAERIIMAIGAGAAAAAGAWFVIAPVVSSLWNQNVSLTGAPLGDTQRQSLEYLGFYYGLGAVILFVGAAALGRLSVIDALDRQLASAARPAVAPAADVASASDKRQAAVAGRPMSTDAAPATEPGIAGPVPAPASADASAAGRSSKRTRRWVWLRRPRGRRDRIA